MPPTEEVVDFQARFAVIGDYGTDDQAEDGVSDLVHSWHPDFIVTLGDNNLPLGGADTIDDNIGQYYHDYIYPYKGGYGTGANTLRFFPSLGNHDWETSSAQAYLDYFQLPGNERYYDFTWGPVHFFILDSDPREPDGAEEGTIQASWLQAALAAAPEPWKIVSLHHAPYTSSITEPSTERMRWPFAAWGATAVLSGHVHTYERFEIDGIPYFVNGLGGQDIFQFGEPRFGSLVRYNGDHGAMLIQATHKQITFVFVNSAGEIIDTFVLSKN